jgi:ABC-2 type transport system permease protein
MRKILTIAFREYKAMVGTKAFLLSITMMPILMLGSLFVMNFLQNRAEIKTRKIAVLDHTGIFYGTLFEAAAKRNQKLDDQLARSKQLGNDPSKQPPPGMNLIRERYLLEQVTPLPNEPSQLAELCNKIRQQELYAIVEIPCGIADLIDAQPTKPKTASDELTKPTKDASPAVRFYSEESGLAESKSWIAGVINQKIREQRFEDLNIDPADVAKASVQIAVNGMGLASRNGNGSVVAAEKQTEPLQAIFVPLGVMILMFAVIFMAAQPMLESVMEEKSQRIAEVLLGSVNAFQLMTGKLLGTVSGSLTVFLIYSTGLLGMSYYNGSLDQLPLELAPWFLTFQILGVLFYASIFLAIGASVSQLKEAQALLLPVWLMMMSPMFAWLLLVRDPLGKTSTLVSFFPPATPTAMMLRMATGRSVPWWQPTVGALVLALCTLTVVFFAARIFRTGILWQGKTPKISEVLRWGLRG